MPPEVSNVDIELLPMSGKIIPSQLSVSGRFLMEIKVITLLAQGSTEFIGHTTKSHVGSSTKFSFDLSSSRGSILDHL